MIWKRDNLKTPSNKILTMSKRLSLKRGYSRCGHGFGGFGGFDGLSGFGGFDGFTGFDE